MRRTRSSPGLRPRPSRPRSRHARWSYQANYPALPLAEGLDGAGGADGVAGRSGHAGDAVQVRAGGGLDSREPGSVGGAEDDAAGAGGVAGARGRAGDVADDQAGRQRDAGAVLPGGGVAAHGAAAVAEGVGIVDRVAAGAGRAGTQVGDRLGADARGTARLQPPGPAGGGRHQPGGRAPLMAADELVAAGPARPGRRAGDPFQGGTVQLALAAVSAPYDAGRGRLAGPRGPRVPGGPAGAARSRASAR